MAAANATIVIDGSHGEGGGALLRTALAMAATTLQPVKINHVREGTNHPGLDPEDLTILCALADSCAAELSDHEIGSSTISFFPTRRPKGLKGRLESVRGQTNRGANALIVLNTLLPVLAQTGTYSSVTIEGETYGNNALSYDAFAAMTLPLLRKVGLYAETTLSLAGFGREALGEVNLNVEPSALNGMLWLERGRFLGVKAIITTSQLPATVYARGAAHLSQLAQSANLPLEIEHNKVDGTGPGAHVTVFASYEKGLGGGTAMGARGMKIETLVQSAFEETFQWMRTDATIDPYLSDQILLPCAIANAPSAFRVSRLTQRFLTTVWVIKQFLPIHITVRGSEGTPGTVSIER